MDGVRILATPGHTAGHQAVLVEAAGRRVVIGAQVVWHSNEFTSETASAANVDPIPDLQHAAVESIRRPEGAQSRSDPPEPLRSSPTFDTVTP